MARASLALLPCLLLAGCTHVPVNVKQASSRQADMLSALDQELAKQNLGKACQDSFAAAASMEETIAAKGQEVQATINGTFADSMVRAQKLKEKDAKLGAEKESRALQTMIEETTKLQSQLASLHEQATQERRKCPDALAALQESVHSLAQAQGELDKFVQSDAKSPAEAFLFEFSQTKALSRRLDEKTAAFQSKLDGAAEKLQSLESILKQVEGQ